MQQVRVTILKTDHCCTEDLGAALALLSEAELDRFKKFHFDQDGKDFAFAHALLRKCLSELVPETEPGSWQFATRMSGKPMVTTRPDLDFSLTHTRGLVACVVADTGLVGIDAELDQRSLVVDPLLDDVCSPWERRELAGLTGRARTSRFLDFWTLKEAFLKACGLGISRDLTRISATITDDCIIRLEVPPDLARPDMSFRIFRIDDGGRVALAKTGPLKSQEIKVETLVKWQA